MAIVGNDLLEDFRFRRSSSNEGKIMLENTAEGSLRKNDNRFASPQGASITSRIENDNRSSPMSPFESATNLVSTHRFDDISCNTDQYKSMSFRSVASATLSTNAVGRSLSQASRQRLAMFRRDSIVVQTWLDICSDDHIVSNVSESQSDVGRTKIESHPLLQKICVTNQRQQPPESIILSNISHEASNKGSHAHCIPYPQLFDPPPPIIPRKSFMQDSFPSEASLLDDASEDDFIFWDPEEGEAHPL